MSIITEAGKKDRAANHLFSDKYFYCGSYHRPTVVKLVTYNFERYQTREVDVPGETFAECIDPDCVNWFQVTGISQVGVIERLAADFNLAPLDVKSIVTPCHAAKIDEMDDRLMIVMRSCIFEKNNTVSSEHITIISKGNLVLTFAERDDDKFEPVLQSLQRNVMGLRTEGTGMLVAFILNACFSETIETALKVEEMLEKIDDILLDAHHAAGMIGGKIQQCRHANLILLKNSVPLKDEFPKLFGTSIVKSTNLMRQLYNELYNQIDFIALTNANGKELLASMRDLYAANNDIRTNTIMRRLTVVSTLFIPVTFLVGFWGMNFEFMPETKWEYGYILGLIAIAGTFFVTWHYMKKNRWF